MSFKVEELKDIIIQLSNSELKEVKVFLDRELYLSDLAIKEGLEKEE